MVENKDHLRLRKLEAKIEEILGKQFFLYGPFDINLEPGDALELMELLRISTRLSVKGNKLHVG